MSDETNKIAEKLKALSYGEMLAIKSTMMNLQADTMSREYVAAVFARIGLAVAPDDAGALAKARELALHARRQQPGEPMMDAVERRTKELVDLADFIIASTNRPAPTNVEPPAAPIYRLVQSGTLHEENGDVESMNRLAVEWMKKGIGSVIYCGDTIVDTYSDGHKTAPEPTADAGGDAGFDAWFVDALPITAMRNASRGFSKIVWDAARVDVMEKVAGVRAELKEIRASCKPLGPGSYDWCEGAVDAADRAIRAFDRHLSASAVPGAAKEGK